MKAPHLWSTAAERDERVGSKSLHGSPSRGAALATACHVRTPLPPPPPPKAEDRVKLGANKPACLRALINPGRLDCRGDDDDGEGGGAMTKKDSFPLWGAGAYVPLRGLSVECQAARARKMVEKTSCGGAPRRPVAVVGRPLGRGVAGGRGCIRRRRRPRQCGDGGTIVGRLGRRSRGSRPPPPPRLPRPNKHGAHSHRCPRSCVPVVAGAAHNSSGVRGRLPPTRGVAELCRANRPFEARRAWSSHADRALAPFRPICGVTTHGPGPAAAAPVGRPPWPGHSAHVPHALLGSTV